MGVCGRPKAGNTFDALDKWLLKNAWNTRSKRRRKKTCLAPTHQLFASHAHSRQMRTTWRRLQRAWSQYTLHITKWVQATWVTLYIFNKKIAIHNINLYSLNMNCQSRFMPDISQCIPIPQAHLFYAKCRKYINTRTHTHTKWHTINSLSCICKCIV